MNKITCRRAEIDLIFTERSSKDNISLILHQFKFCKPNDLTRCVINRYKEYISRFKYIIIESKRLKQVRAAILRNRLVDKHRLAIK